MHASTYLAITIRVLLALCTRTFFQPDEYFQSLEPAHHLVFGYGHLTWEWLTPHPIRSFVYPAINVPVYWMLKVTGLVESRNIGDWLLIACPKIVHGCLAALTDIYLGEIVLAVLGNDYVSTALLLSLTSLFHALALSRSLSNSLETSLSAIAFAYYPWDASTKLSPQLIFNRTRLRKTITFSILACMTRPTNAVIWVFLYANILWATRHHRRIFLMIARDIVLAGLLALLALLLVDSLYYGKLTFTPLNFLRLNLSSVSLFYGANPWHYYLTQAIPILLTTALPFTFHGVWVSMTSKSTRDTSLKTMLVTILWTVGVYSFAGHKEWRFLHPILPLLHVFAAKSLVDLVSVPSRPRKRGPNLKSGSKPEPPVQSFIRRYFMLPDIPRRHLIVLLATLPVSTYIVLFYCSAPISVLSFLRSIPRTELNRTTIGILMPCHSTPGQAFLHREELANGKMWALGCEPPLDNQNLLMYEDQTTVFFNSPMEYLLTYFPANVNPLFPVSPFPTSIPGVPTPILLSSTLTTQPPYPWRHEWPRYFIFFGQLLREPGTRDILEEQGYKEVWKAGREWEGEGNRKGGVKVWEWSPPKRRQRHDIY